MKTSLLMIVLPLLAGAVASLGCRTGPDDSGQEPGRAPVQTQEPESREPSAPGAEATPGSDQPAAEPREQGPAPVVQDPESGQMFLAHAFPPTMPDTEWHRDAWMLNDCMRCHETGVQDAPEVEHLDMPDILLVAKCRSCHVLIPGSKPRPRPEPDPEAESGQFASNAFPPMIPASESHRQAWGRDDCLLCHESGVKGAPIVEHRDMPTILLAAKCRSCHVQVRAVEASEVVR